MNLIARLARWRRERTLRRHPVPDDAWRALVAGHAFIAALPAGQLERLRELTSLFCADKEFSGAGGFTVDGRTQLAIAAQACLPVLELGLSLYAGWHEIVVYPGEVVARREFVDEDGVAHEYDEVIAGEAMPGGPVVLSWEDVTLAGAADARGYNVVIHEFVHKIDMSKGHATGIPPLLAGLHAGLDHAEFAAELGRSFRGLARAVSRWERRGALDAEAPLIDPYAADSPVEFFAVVSEAFFTKPAAVRAQLPELYPWLVAYFRQDPGTRPAASA